MFTPLNVKLKKMVEEGVIGTLRTIRAEYSSEVLGHIEEDHWVLGETMGGCTYDVGVYPICFSHYFAAAGIKELCTQAFRHPRFVCDFGMQADVFYENGVYAFLQSSWFYTPEHKGTAVLVGDAAIL